LDLNKPILIYIYIKLFSLEIKTLEATSIEDIVDCLLDAFSEYFVKFPDDISYWKQRWHAARVDYSVCYGAFIEDQLVGLIIHGIDKQDKIAFNTGTGVRKAHRGKQITKRIYEFAFNDLIKKGFLSSKLEVIQKNQNAIKVYSDVGFSKIKSYKCYKGELDHVQSNSDIFYKPSSLEKILEFQYKSRTHYSWDFTDVAIERNDSYIHYLVSNSQEEIGYFIINPVSGRLAQFELIDGVKASYHDLFTAVKTVNNSISIVNLDESQVAKVSFVTKIGLENNLDQYEMWREL